MWRSVKKDTPLPHNGPSPGDTQITHIDKSIVEHAHTNHVRMLCPTVLIKVNDIPFIIVYVGVTVTDTVYVGETVTKSTCNLRSMFSIVKK